MISDQRCPIALLFSDCLSLTNHLWLLTLAVPQETKYCGIRVYLRFLQPVMQRHRSFVHLPLWKTKIFEKDHRLEKRICSIWSKFFSFRVDVHWKGWHKWNWNVASKMNHFILRKKCLGKQCRPRSHDLTFRQSMWHEYFDNYINFSWCLLYVFWYFDEERQLW